MDGWIRIFTHGCLSVCIPVMSKADFSHSCVCVRVLLGVRACKHCSAVKSFFVFLYACVRVREVFSANRLFWRCGIKTAR